MVTVNAGNRGLRPGVVAMEYMDWRDPSGEPKCEKGDLHRNTYDDHKVRRRALHVPLDGDCNVQRFVERHSKLSIGRHGLQDVRQHSKEAVVGYPRNVRQLTSIEACFRDGVPTWIILHLQAAQEDMTDDVLRFSRFVNVCPKTLDVSIDSVNKEYRMTSRESMC